MAVNNILNILGRSELQLANVGMHMLIRRVSHGHS